MGVNEFKYSIYDMIFDMHISTRYVCFSKCMSMGICCCFIPYTNLEGIVQINLELFKLESFTAFSTNCSV